jgi:NADH-quinone oxidoreductase subunit H
LGVLGSLIINLLNLVYAIIFILIITLIIAALTLIERKFLSLIQRRIGPYYVGYRGRLQYIADALKLFLKGAIIPVESNYFLFLFLPSCVAGIIYLFWVNSVWGPSLSIFEIEYNLVFSTLLSIFFGYCIMLTGYVSKSKYAFLASIRSCVLMLNIEILLGLMFLTVVSLSESFTFSFFVLLQQNFFFIINMFFTIPLVCICFLLETNRSPFDLAEAESELVSGYNVEYGGFFFALYYLGEYFHLFFFSMTISLLFLGGWETPFFFFKLQFFVF